MIEVIKAGIFSSIQDQGRFGYRNIGVPTSGVMDAYSANLANSLLHNNLNCAVLETTIIGPTLKFNQETLIAITGAQNSSTINDKPVSLNTVIHVYEGDVLSIAKATTGVRNYLAVCGGFQTSHILNSRSFYTGITQAIQIKKGDVFIIQKPLKNIINRTSIVYDEKFFNQKTMQVTQGPEYALLSLKNQQELLSHDLMVSPHSNRMGYKLEHSIRFDVKDIITSSVQPGTVQLTPAGELIVLMRDCQTTGGYARVLQLTKIAINQLAQKPASTTIRFGY